MRKILAESSIKPGTVRIYNSAEKIIDWLRWADDDYIAARQLLLGDLLVQGAGLSNTAIEKYLKTILWTKDPPAPKGHDLVWLFERLKKKGIVLNLRKNYLALLFKLYRLRYPDELEKGFGVAIDRTRMLTELDRSVFEIRKGFEIVGPFGRLGSTIEELLAKRDDRLLNRNCYFGEAMRADLFAETCPRYALRVLQPRQLVWATYETYGVPDEPNFKAEFAVAFSDNRMDAHLPLE